MGRWLDRLKQIHTEQGTDAPARGDALVKGALDSAASFVPDDVHVAWRVAAMRPQVPLRGPIPRLLARLGIPEVDAPDCCGACGDPLPPGSRFVCPPCVHAKWIVLLAVRES